ncbi:MAG: hypothetical protein ACRDT6_02635 [Micromonosporaceae bacterium]
MEVEEYRKGSYQCRATTSQGKGPAKLELGVTVVFSQVYDHEPYRATAERALREHGPGVSECLLFDIPTRGASKSLKLDHGEVCATSYDNADLKERHAEGRYTTHGMIVKVRTNVYPLPVDDPLPPRDSAIKVRDLVLNTLMAETRKN